MPTYVKPWTKEEECRLKELWIVPNLTVSDIANQLKKKPHIVKARAKLLHLSKRSRGGSRSYVTASIRMGCGGKTNRQACISCKKSFLTQHGRQRDRVCKECKNTSEWRSSPQYLIHT